MTMAPARESAIACCLNAAVFTEVSLNVVANAFLVGLPVIH